MATQRKILFLHVDSDIKIWFNKITHEFAATQTERVTQSSVGDLILKHLKANPKVLKDALRCK